MCTSSREVNERGLRIIECSLRIIMLTAHRNIALRCANDVIHPT